jgi:SPX domain protein involved in polyphosphate accumulation
MEGVKLMDRTDTKFTFRMDQLEIILNEMKTHYKVVEIRSARICSYETLYYDTGGLKLYHAHHSGKLNRYKVRKRNYTDSGISFLEVKFKNNKGRTIKQRVKEKGNKEDFELLAADFLNKQLPFDPKSLSPVVWVNYGRITLVNKKDAERVTIDIGLHFIKGDKTCKLDQLVIAEVKQGKKAHSPFIDGMKAHFIREGGISKYCMAVAATHSRIKINNFKEKLISIHKITQHDFITNRL